MFSIEPCWVLSALSIRGTQDIPIRRSGRSDVYGASLSGLVVCTAVNSHPFKTSFATLERIAGALRVLVRDLFDFRRWSKAT